MKNHALQKLMWNDLYHPPNPNPLVRVLTYSAGRQSHFLARLCLRGEHPMPDLVVAADPGGEHKDTIRIRDKTLAEFRAKGIPADVAPGPKMLDELRESVKNQTRLDNMAYWTANGGQLQQCCTRHYKIRPMERWVLQHAYTMHGLRLPSHSIESWICFAWDERHRVKTTKADHRQQLHYPIFCLQMTRGDILKWYERTGEEMPPPSVCNWCWANGTKTFHRIATDDPGGWQNAKVFDMLSRSLINNGVREQCFCSSTLLSLEELEQRNFLVDADTYKHLSCDSGYCFT